MRPGQLEIGIQENTICRISREIRIQFLPPALEDAMKKSMVVLVLCGIISMSSFSQVQVSKGSFVGVGLAAFARGYGEGFLPRLNVGIFAKAPLVEGLSVRPEVAYSQRGDMSTSSSVVLEYLDVSVLAEYEFILLESSGLSVHMMGGPMVSRMFQASSQTHSGLTTVAVDIYGSTSIFDYGLLLGGGFGIDVGNGSMFVETRVFIGLKKITLPAFGSPMQNRSVAFVTGFEF